MKSLLRAKSIYEVVYEQKTGDYEPWGKRYVTYFSNKAHAKLFYRQKKKENYLMFNIKKVR